MSLSSSRSRRTVPAWLEADHDNFTGRLLHTPEREEIDTPVEEQLIIEFYSRYATLSEQVVF